MLCPHHPPEWMPSSMLVRYVYSQMNFLIFIYSYVIADPLYICISVLRNVFCSLYSHLRPFQLLMEAMRWLVHQRKPERPFSNRLFLLWLLRRLALPIRLFLVQPLFILTNFRLIFVGTYFHQTDNPLSDTPPPASSSVVEVIVYQCTPFNFVFPISDSFHSHSYLFLECIFHLCYLLFHGV